MLKQFTFLCLGLCAPVAASTPPEEAPANVHDDNHYIMIGASVSIVEGISSTVGAKPVEVQEESKKEVSAEKIEEIENAAEGISASVVPK